MPGRLLFPEAEETRSLYSNLYKAGWVVVNDDTRIIDTNELLKKRLMKAAAENHPAGEGETGGFTSGLNAEVVDALLEDESNIRRQAALEEQAALEQEIVEARAELERMKAEADQMMDTASVQIEHMRAKALEEAKNQGYQAGYEEGMAQVQGMKNDCKKKQAQLQAEYNRKVEELEPDFIEALTGIYEHIFKVDLSVYSQIVVNMLTDTMQKTDSASNYIVHVSKQDYPQVMKERERILEGTGTLSNNLEIVSDMTLSTAQCMIETENGIYDCSLGTELEELGRKLRLLSYNKQTM